MTTDMTPPPTRDRLPARSYDQLRRMIGWIGVGLPVALLFTGWVAGRGTSGSISAYYHSSGRDVLVGALCAIGVFLWCYRVERVDDRLGNLAGALAVAVALLPTAPPDPTPGQQLVGVLHLVAAGGFFLTLAWFAHRRFPQLDPGCAPTPGKARRNALYRACARTIVGALVLAVLADRFLPRPVVDAVHPVFWLESVAVWAFGVSWVVKGRGRRP